MKQKRFKHARFYPIAQIVCLILCLIMSIGTLAGCHSDDGPAQDPSTTDSSATGTTGKDVGDSGEVTDDVDPDLKDDLADSYNFDRDYIILSRSSTSYEFESKSSISGDLVSNAIFTRNSLVEDRTNVTLKLVPLAGDWVTTGNPTFEAAVRNNAGAGSSAYDLVATHSAYLANLAVEGLGIDLSDLPHVDLTKRWWSEAYYEECNYNGSIYMMIGDLAYTIYEYMEVVFFNENKANALQLDDLYEIALNGEWTYELMKEYTALVESDPDDGDAREYGLLTNCHAERAFPNAVDALYAAQKSDGTRYFPGTINPTTASKLSDFIDFVCNSEGVLSPKGYGTEAATLNPIFAGGKALFYMQTLGESMALKSTITDSYGVLPFPKWNEEQIEYHTSCRDSMTAILVPGNIQDRESTGVVTELLSMYGYEHITNAYYEKVLKLQSFNDPACIETLEIIRTSANLSFQQVFSNCIGSNPNSLVSNIINNRGTSELSTEYKRQVGTWNSGIEKLYEDLNRIQQNQQ